jgi:hypothetical protein
MAEYRALYDAAGRFHDAPPHLFEGLDEYLRTLQAPEVGRRAFRHTYGFEYCYEADRLRVPQRSSCQITPTPAR